MIAELDSYDWAEVFGYAGEPGHDANSAGSAPVPAVPPGDPTEGQDQPPVLREDVTRIIAQREGENEGPQWLILGAAKGGRFFFIEAGCDYTGWDCQAGGTCRVSPSLEALWRWGVTDEERRALAPLMSEADLSAAAPGGGKERSPDAR